MLYKKTRNILFYLVALSLIFGYSLSIQAAPVNETEAYRIAAKWAKILNLPEMKPLATQRELKDTVTFTRADRKVAYLFEQNVGGFILVGADDRLSAILAYSKENSFDPEIPVVKIFLEGLAYKLKRAETIGTQRNEQWNFVIAAKPASYNIAAVEGPLLTTTWNQEPRYNNLCPEISGEKCLTGCVATATAQIMRHHQHPASGSGSHSYTWRSSTLSADFGNTTYDWANMPDELTASSTQAQIDAVAELCYHAGVSVEMDYGTDASSASTYNCIAALAQYFYYKRGQEVEKANFSDQQWFNIMSDEIRSQRPVLYGVTNHAVVLDGVNDTLEQPYVHLNMGWGGYSDGWYDFNAFTTASGRTYNHLDAVIGIEPNDVAARTHYVDNDSGDDGNDGLSWNTAKKTIRATIFSSLEGDDVLVKYGRYDITSPIDFSGTNIRLASDDGTHNSFDNATKDAAQCVIDAGGSCVVFNFHRDETSDSAVAGFTIRNGSGDFGGGIECLNASPTISHNIISNNAANYGGGIYCQDSSPVIENNTISDNSAVTNGGGIACNKADAVVRNNTISNNSVTNYNGGGIYCYESSPVIENNTISDNTAATEGGGGIYCSKQADKAATIANNTISGNSADNGSGGGVFCSDQANAAISNNTISNNSAGFGGGIFCHQASPTIENNTISDNSASSSGSGIYCSTSSVNITNNLIYKNSATNNYGGGIYSTGSGTLTLANNTIADNTANLAGTAGIMIWTTTINMVNTIVWNNKIYCADNSTLNVSYSDVQGGENDVSNQNATVNWGTDNIDEDPLFVDAVGGDYHLQENSPCIDAGTTDGAPLDDIEGNSRDAFPDMGAYEFGATPDFPTGDVSGDETVSAYDAALVFQHIQGIIQLSADQIDRGNVDGQNGLTVDDANLILQRVVGLIDKFPTE